MSELALALASVPDEPACIEARGMLLSGRGSVAWARAGALVVYAPMERLASIVGRVSWIEVAPVLDGLAPDVEVLIREDDLRHAEGVPHGWRGQHVTVHVEREALPLVDLHHRVRALASDEAFMLKHVPRELREELEQALTFATIVVAFDQELPVAFCYAGWETETLWDVSIDTLGSWRRQGYGTAAARELMTIMRSRGKRAVWAALDTNRASLGVAVNLGFEPVAKLHVLTRASGL